MNPTAPGLVPYSREWLDACATTVRPEHRRLVLTICTAFDLGTSWMPNALGRLLEEEEAMRKEEIARSISSDELHGDEPSPMEDAIFTNERADYNAEFLEARR